MQRTPPAASPDAYVAALSGWQRKLVEELRAAILAGARFEQIIKWTNLMFVSNGLAILIRAEDSRVLLGCFRGKGWWRSIRASSPAANMNWATSPSVKAIR